MMSVTRKLLLAGSALLCATCATPELVGQSESQSASAPPQQLTPLPEANYLLAVSPTQLGARQHVGAAGEAPLVFELRVPALLRGGGVPKGMSTGAEDLAVVQLELPMGPATTDTSDEDGGVAVFSLPRFCAIDTSGNAPGAPACPERERDGYWRADVIGEDGQVREVQVGYAMRDPMFARVPYPHVIGVFLPLGEALLPKDRLRLTFRGYVSGLATDWTDRPFVPHLRYRSFAGRKPGPWTLVTEDQIEPLQITGGYPTYVRALAPLDVPAGLPFPLAVVVTDRYGNPTRYTGTVALSGGVEAELQLDNEWRRELQVVVDSPGFVRFVPRLTGLRAVYHYTMVHDGEPPVQRLVGDIHSHTGDGGAQRQFLGRLYAGDHRALFTRTVDALRYAELAAGLDFGAVSEHAYRWDEYQLPAAVKADPAFQKGGACSGVGDVYAGLGNWWGPQQQRVRDYGGDPSVRLIAFPAYEWHAGHNERDDTSPLHRVVLFRDFDPTGALPMLPGDLYNVPPQCLVRFLRLTGYPPDKALIVPHMTLADDNNVDWDKTYADTGVAQRSETEGYYRVGEIFSARAFNQQRLRGALGKPLLTVFEGADQSPGRWTFRYGLAAQSAHIGIIASSDNHEQMPGVNDDVRLDGEAYRSNESGGYAVVLAGRRDRDGVYDGMLQRRTYGTSGVRAWLDFQIGGVPMGGSFESSATDEGGAITLAAGLPIRQVEVWEARVGDRSARYVTTLAEQPGEEIYDRTFTIQNPVPADGPPQERLYYLRATLSAPSSRGTGGVDEMVWSSPIWIRWSR